MNRVRSGTDETKQFSRKNENISTAKNICEFLTVGFFRIREIHICKFNRFSLSHSPIVGVFIMD